ncbi:HSP70 family member 2 [Trichonephila clavipes]|nr:HSP70 family member 2 [Trichonephila clavipes]
MESFFKNDEGHNVTVNGDRYRAMITNFFIPELNNHDVQELWFQQDGATCHTARATIDLLKDTFGDRLISRFGLVNRPPRSCDLTPLDYFLWGYVKSLVYADKPQTLDHLEDNIRRVIADIRPQMLEKVIENWTSRLDYIRASRGSHMPKIIFKIKEVCTPSHEENESSFSVDQQRTWTACVEHESLYECRVDTNIHFIYGLANGNDSLYGKSCTTRQQQNHQTLALHQNLVEHGYFRAKIDDMPVNSEMDLVARISIAADTIYETPERITKQASRGDTVDGWPDLRLDVKVLVDL